MSKSYWHSIGSGALGMNAPWNTPVIGSRNRVGSVRRAIVRAFAVSILLAFATGIMIGVCRHVTYGNSDPQENALFAYQVTGMAIDDSVGGAMRLVGLNAYAPSIQKHVLAYVAQPFQLFAFSGAFVVTAGTHLIDGVLTTVTYGR